MAIDLHKLERYMFETLGVYLKPVPWNGVGKLSLFLQQHYSYVVIHLLGYSFLLMVDEGKEEKSPANLRKHTKLLGAQWSGEIINKDINGESHNILTSITELKDRNNSRITNNR